MAVLHNCECGFFCTNCGKQCQCTSPPPPQQINESNENVHPPHHSAGGDTYDKKEQNKSWNTDHLSKSLKYGDIAVASVSAIPIVAGFGTAGIVGGFIAALVQYSIGNVAAGSAFAALSSVGATGVFATGATAGGTAAGAGYIAVWWSKKKKKASDKDESSQGDSKNTEKRYEQDVALKSKEMCCQFCGCVFEVKENRIGDVPHKVILVSPNNDWDFVDKVYLITCPNADAGSARLDRAKTNLDKVGLLERVEVKEFVTDDEIIYVILRSKSGIKTTYHRIILGLSIADCAASLAIALTTLLMPKDVIYPFALASHGNVATCEAQGLVYIIGNAACFCMNGVLNIYYLCSLRFNMPEKTFRCYLEIPLYIVTLLMSIGVPCARLINKQLLNPSPTDPYCVPNSYPAGCTKEDNPDCRGSVGGRDAFLTGYLFILSIATFTLLVTMTLIIHSFYRNERKLRKAVKDKQIQEEDEAFQALLYAQKTSGIITRQALLYIAAFVITWIFGFLEALSEKEVIELTDRGARTLSTFRVCFQHLQGFFNLIIFIYHKACILLTSDEDMTLAEAMNEIFLKPGQMEDSVQIHNLDVVLEDNFAYGVNYAGNAQETSIENGSEDVSCNASKKRISSTCAHTGALPSIEEEKAQPRKYYYAHAAASTILNFKKNDHAMTDLTLAPESTMQEHNDGVSFASEHSKSPSQARNERNDRTEVFRDDDETNLSYPSGSRSISSKLSGFSSVLRE